MNNHELKLYSKSGVEQDWSCKRKYYWGYAYGGRGLTKGSTHLALFLGTAIHDGLAAIAHNLNIDDIAEAAYKQVYDQLNTPSVGVIESEVVEFAKEQASLVEGLLRGFHRQVWPQLIRQYPTIIAIEPPCLYKYSGLGFMSRPDLILADQDGNWIIIEYKTTSNKKTEWINSWNTAIQVHSEIKAVEQTLGTTPQNVIVVGLYKGFISYGKQSSPLIYAYKKSGNPPFTQDIIQYEYKNGFRRFATWELEGGVKKWVAEMPENILASQYPQTPPIFVNEDLVKAFFYQRWEREKEIATFKHVSSDPSQLERVFPQTFSECAPAWGSGCPFFNLCHYEVGDPLENGYQWRDTEHLQPFIDLAQTSKLEELDGR